MYDTCHVVLKDPEPKALLVSPKKLNVCLRRFYQFHDLCCCLCDSDTGRLVDR